MRFVETPVFTRAICEFVTDEVYRALQIALLLRPEQGSLIPGGGGLRKVRCQSAGSGKRGGLRIIYFWHPEEAVFYMLLAYPKSHQQNLSPEQSRILRRVVKEDLK